MLSGPTGSGPAKAVSAFSAAALTRPSESFVAASIAPIPAGSPIFARAETHASLTASEESLRAASASAPTASVAPRCPRMMAACARTFREESPRSARIAASICASPRVTVATARRSKLARSRTRIAASELTLKRPAQRTANSLDRFRPTSPARAYTRSEPVRESPDRAGRARREQRKARRPKIPRWYLREEQRSDAKRIARSGDGRGFLHGLSGRGKVLRRAAAARG